MKDVKENVVLDEVVKEVLKKICNYYKEEYTKIDYYLEYIKRESFS